MPHEKWLALRLQHFFWVGTEKADMYDRYTLHCSEYVKNQNKKFLCLYRTFNLFLVILLCLWLWKPKRQVFRLTKNFVFGSFTSFLTSKPKRKVLCLDKTFIPCSLAWFMALKTKTGSFYDLIRPLFLVFVYGFNFQQGKFL